MVNVGATSQIKAHIRWNTSTGTCVGSQCSTNSPSHQAEFSVPHVALFHSIYEEDAAFWQYNSCVEFTFRGRGDSNTRKMKQLNNIFEKVADKLSGGLREDHLLKLLPAGSTGKFGLQSNSKKVAKPHRLLSRGTFLAMFSNESASFIFNMTQNARLIKGLKMPVNKEKRGTSLPIELETSLSREFRTKKSKESKKKKKKKRKGKDGRKSKKDAKVKEKLSMVEEKTDDECSHSECSLVGNPYGLGKDAMDFTNVDKDSDCKFFGNFSNTFRKIFPIGRGHIIVPYN